MTPTNPLQASAATSVIPLARPPEPEPTTSKAQARSLDLVLAGGVIALAILIASFVIRNSDFWQHLATGRLLIQGGYGFGVDPFAYTSEGSYWINPSWLFDLTLYLLYVAVGGAGLVLLKAGLVAALAALMLAVRRRGEGLAIPAACTAVALVAMSPRLLVQPSLLSSFLLGLSLWMLWRPHAAAKPMDAKQSAVLLVVFALWANLDSWFLLGPILAGLFWLGDQVSGTRRTPGWLALAGIAVCLINPHHFNVFTRVGNFAPWLQPGELAQDIRFRRLFSSPWPLGLHGYPPAAINLAEWAYFVLVFLGAASFYLRPPALRDWRLPVWLAFALLSSLEIRAVPYFAVIAAPIATLNLQDFLASRSAPAARVRFARGAILLGEVALIGLTLLGWLHGFRPDGRKIGLGVRPDSSLERVATTLARWRQEGRLDDHARIFNFHPDVAHVAAWFCPGEKFFFHSRLANYPNIVGDYEVVCAAINPTLTMDAGENAAATQQSAKEVLKRYGVTHLVVYDSTNSRLLDTMHRLDQGSGEWSLARIDGQALVYVKAAVQDPIADFHVRAERVVLDPEYPRGEEFPPSPDTGSGRGPQDPWAMESVLRLDAPASWEAAAASALLRAHDDHAWAELGESRLRAGLNFTAALIGQPASRAGLASATAVLCRLRNSHVFMSDADARSPALPLLAIRAARHALAANPNDAIAWLRLGQAYLALRSASSGPASEYHLSPLLMLRQIQVATALENALVLEPNLLAAHEFLAQLYAEQGFLDAALPHLRKRLELTRRSGPAPEELPDAFATRVSYLEQQVAELDRMVQDKQNQFAVRSQEMGDNVLNKAFFAVSLGLAKQSLDEVLLKAQYLQFGSEGARLQLMLMLRLGRTSEVKDRLLDEGMRENRDRLGEFEIPGPLGMSRIPAYQWFLACAAAAQGDYEQASSAVIEILRPLEQETLGRLPLLRQMLPLALMRELGLRSQPLFLLGEMAQGQRADLATLLLHVGMRQRMRADLEALAGLVALERGQPDTAEGHLRLAVQLAPGLEKDSALIAPCRGLAQSYLRRIDAFKKEHPSRPGGTARPR
jgi:tetratricopeptide (TPR) repeat protein